MGFRYIVSGVQLGMLIAIPNQDERKKVVDEIQEKQCIGQTCNSVEDDAKLLSDFFEAQS